MERLRKLIRTKSYIIALLIIAVASHWEWFNLTTILNSADWSYWPDAPVKQLYYSWGAWISYFNLGSANIQIPFNFFNITWSFLANLGFSYDLATKITFLIPIAILGFIAPYILFKKLTEDSFIAFSVALFYGATTHFLIRQTAHLPIAFVYALASLIIYYFLLALEKNKIGSWLIFILVYWVGICYEIRITYVLTFILVAYFFYFKVRDLKRYSKNILISLVFLLGLNMFWLLPALFGGLSADISAVANRGLFGNFLFNLQNAFLLSEPAWTGGMPDNRFISQPIMWYFWLIPIFIFSSLLLVNHKYNRELVFFGFISLIGIFLTKQGDLPFAKTYSWMYENVPTFNLFREASKFYLITAVGYSGMLGYGLLILKEKNNRILSKYIFSSFALVFIAISLWNLMPLFTKKIGTMFVARHIPTDYLILNDFLAKQSGYFRTIWIPSYSRWGNFVNNQPKASQANLADEDWNAFENSKSQSEQKRIVEIYNKSYSNQLFDSSSIKYVIIPIRDIENDDDFFIDYGGEMNPDIRNWYIGQIDRVKWLTRINIGTKDLAVYENNGYQDHLFLTAELNTALKDTSFLNAKWKMINPAKYKVSLKNIREGAYLNFSERYHPDWNLKLGKFDWFGVISQNNYFLDGKYHLKNGGRMNSFLIDPKVIRQEYKGDYKENPDGSIDIEITLYFKAQSYFYLGSIISGFTLLSCLIFLILLRIRKADETSN